MRTYTSVVRHASHSLFGNLRTSHAARCTGKALSLNAYLLYLMMSFATESVTARFAEDSAFASVCKAYARSITGYTVGECLLPARELRNDQR